MFRHIDIITQEGNNRLLHAAIKTSLSSVFKEQHCLLKILEFPFYTMQKTKDLIKRTALHLRCAPRPHSRTEWLQELVKI